MKERSIVILGGGFAGTTLARRLKRLMPPSWDIVLLSKENYITYTPLLPEVVGASILPGHAVAPIRQMIRRTRYYRAEVTDLDLDQRELRYRGAGSGVMGYDHLVLACGTRAKLDMTLGMAQHALPLVQLGDALDLRNRVILRLEEVELEADRMRRQWLTTFVVIGGNFSGIEAAGAVATYGAVCRAPGTAACRQPAKSGPRPRVATVRLSAPRANCVGGTSKGGGSRAWPEPLRRPSLGALAGGVSCQAPDSVTKSAGLFRMGLATAVPTRCDAVPLRALPRFLEPRQTRQEGCGDKAQGHRPWVRGDTVSFGDSLMPDVDTKRASLGPKLSCEICKKEIPRSTARSAEGEDYVFYFCGPECYAEWKRLAPTSKP